MNPQDVPDYRTTPKIIYSGTREWTRRILATILVATVFGTAGFCGGKTRGTVKVIEATEKPCVESIQLVNGSACNGSAECGPTQTLVQMGPSFVKCACPGASSASASAP